MTALKKLSLFALLAVLALLPAGTANAQENIVTCQAAAVTPLIRAEGIAELVGDITLVCTSTLDAPTDDEFEVNVDVFTSAFVTNNRSFGAGTDITDAVLVINENNCTAPASAGGTYESCSGTNENAGGPGVPNQDPQFGLLAANNNLRWNGVVFPVPDGDAGDNATQTILRITSVRVNASMLGVPDEDAPVFTQVQATLVITGESAINVNNQEFNIGLPLRGLTVDSETVASGLQCESIGGHGSFTLHEGFPTAFKTLGVATFTIGSNIQNEAGYHGSDEGGATQSTHFLVTFHNIPEGVRIGVEDNPDCTEGGSDSDHLALDAVDCDVNGDSCGAASPIADAGDPLNGAVEVDIDGGTGWIGYEVTDDWTIASEDCTVEVWAAWTPDTENNLPAPGTGQMSVSFAPLSTVGTSTEDDEPRPRFLDGTGSDPENIVNVVKCTSTILFPFVTNQNGFDTGLVVSNTSEDWLGTEPQDGACEIHYHGSTTGGGAAPATDPTDVIGAGEQLIWLLSSGNPAQGVDPAFEFQGYIIVVCDFQYGHGYAFITDGFGSVPTLAQGYLALLLEFDSNGARVLPESLDQ